MSRLKSFSSIKDKRDFDRVYKRASRVWHTDSFVLFYLSKNEKKVAFVASKRVGKAVARNRAKRVLRALFLEQIDRYRSGNYILVAKSDILNRDFKYLKKAWLNSLKRCKLYQNSQKIEE